MQFFFSISDDDDQLIVSRKYEKIACQSGATRRESAQIHSTLLVQFQGKRSIYGKLSET